MKVSIRLVSIALSALIAVSCALPTTEEQRPPRQGPESKSLQRNDEVASASSKCKSKRDEKKKSFDFFGPPITIRFCLNGTTGIKGSKECQCAAPKIEYEVDRPSEVEGEEKMQVCFDDGYDTLKMVDKAKEDCNGDDEKGFLTKLEGKKFSFRCWQGVNDPEPSPDPSPAATPKKSEENDTNLGVSGKNTDDEDDPERDEERSERPAADRDTVDDDCL